MFHFLRVRQQSFLLTILGAIVLYSGSLAAQGPDSLTMRSNSIFLSLSEPYRLVSNRLSIQQPTAWELPGMQYDFPYDFPTEQQALPQSVSPQKDTPIRGVALPEEATFEMLLEELEKLEQEPVLRGQIGAFPGNNAFWAAAVHSENATGSDRHSVKYGISSTSATVGCDLMRSCSARLGLFGGYTSATLYQGGSRVEADDYQFGGYYQEQFAGTEFNGWISYAHQSLQSRRRDGQNRFDGRTEGDSLASGFELGKTICWRARLFLRPYIGGDLHHGWQYGFEEEAFHQNAGPSFGRLGYDRMHVSQTFLRVGLNAKYESFNWFRANWRIQYAYMLDGDPVPESRMRQLDVPNATTWTVSGADVKRDFLNLGFGAQCALGHAGTRYVYGDYDVQMSENRTIQWFSLGYLEKF